MPTVIDDRLVTLNGVVMESGSMLRTTTVAARVFRHLMAWRGYWPGGNGRLFGCAAWERMQTATDDAQTRADIMRDFEEALDPLVQSGSIHTVEISTKLDRRGRMFLVSWKSARGEPGDIVLTNPLSLNG